MVLLHINFKNPVAWRGRHVDSCGIAAAKLRPRRRYDEQAQRRPAESEVPGTESKSPILKQNRLYLNSIQSVPF
jgi:hypothetical protein